MHLQNIMMVPFGRTEPKNFVFAPLCPRLLVIFHKSGRFRHSRKPAFHPNSLIRTFIELAPFVPNGD